MTVEHHELILTPQTIADGWQGECSCEKWGAFESFYEHPNKEALLARLKEGHRQHTQMTTGKQP